MSLRTLLILAMTAFAAAILFATVQSVGAIFGRAAERDVASELARSAAVFETLRQDRVARDRAEARVVAEEPRLKAVVATEGISHKTVHEMAAEMMRTVKSDLFLLTDAEGTLLADVADAAATGFDLSEDPVVKAAIQSGEATGVWTHRREVYEVVACRLVFGKATVGFLVMGHRLNDPSFATFRRLTGTEAMLVLDGGNAAASPFEGIRPRGDALAGLPPPAEAPATRSLENVRYLATAAPLLSYRGDRALRVAFFRSLDAALAPVRRLQRTLYAIAFGALAVAIVLAALLSRALSRPLDALVAHAALVAGGHLDAALSPEGPREIRQLIEATTRMTAGLKEGEELKMARDRLQRELALARQIQELLVPQRTPALTGFDAASVYKPAAEVGGDYLDFFPAAGPLGALGLAIGDVSGKGVAACIAMALTRSALRGVLTQDRSPSEILLRVAETVSPDLPPGVFVTLLFAWISPEGALTFASAGHTPVGILRGGDGAVSWRMPSPACPGIGMAPPEYLGKRLTDVTDQMSAADVAVFHTDGVTEAFGEDRSCFGDARFASALSLCRGKDARGVADGVLQAVSRFAGRAEQSDDIALIVVRTGAVAPRGPVG